jgi:RNA polymerase sigma factor (sigma-70 family)
MPHIQRRGDLVRDSVPAELVLTAEEEPGHASALVSSTFEAVYEAYVGLLVAVAVKQFRIAEADAKSLAHDVFLSYFLRAEDVRDVRRWLLGGIYNACRHYLRSAARRATQTLESSKTSPETHCAGYEQLMAGEALSCVSMRCQLAMRLRFIEGYTFAEIASELGVSEKYARKFVSSCVRQARGRYLGEGTR